MSEVGTHTEWVWPALTVDSGSVPEHTGPVGGVGSSFDELVEQA